MPANRLKTAASLALASYAPSAAKETQVLTPTWEYVADAVMGGVSSGSLTLDGDVTRLTGRVRLENDGGFVQMAFNLAPGGASVDASGWTGIAFETKGGGEIYEIRLRTDQLSRPWQSFRAPFEAPREWATVRLPFSSFEPRKTEETFDPSRLRRIGVLAIGRAFEADVSVAAIRFYR